jgi:hypothetical protein
MAAIAQKGGHRLLAARFASCVACACGRARSEGHEVSYHCSHMSRLRGPEQAWSTGDKGVRSDW